MDMFFILVLDHFIFPPALWCLFTSRYIWPSGKGSFQFLKKISFQRSNYFQGKDQTAEQKRGDLFQRTIPILITFSYFVYKVFSTIQKIMIFLGVFKLKC